MAETSGFFDAVELADGTYDRSYIAEQFANYFKLFIGNGVFASPTDQCKVIAGSGLNVIVKAGWAFINGYWYHNDTDLTLPIVANTTASSRTDMVILRFDSSSRTIVAQVAFGTTTVDRTTYYGLKLAEVVVGTGVSEIATANITDKRSDETVCGFVTGLLDVISTSDLFNQYQSMFNTWFDSVKGQLTTDAAGAINEKINPRDIAANTDLNTLMANGYYVCQSHAIAPTLLNCPVSQAFEMEVRNINLTATGTLYRYFHQIIRAYDSNKMLIRLINSGGEGVFAYSPWRTYTPSPFGNVFYGTCSTAAATAAKVVSATDFFLSTGVEITVKNTIANTATAPTLNVNGTGAKSIYYHGAAVPAGYFGVGTYKLSYDGSVYNIIEDASVAMINSNLTFPSSQGGLYADYQNGELGINTSATRGADTFHPFKGKPDNLVYYDHASLSTFTYTATKAGIYVVFVQGAFTAQTVTTTGTLLASDIHDKYTYSMVYRLEIGQKITVVTTNTYGTNYGVVRAIVYVGNYTSVTKGTLSQVFNTPNSVLNTYNVSAVALTFAIMTAAVDGIDGWASVSTLNESAAINQYRRKEAHTSVTGSTLFHAVVSPSLYEAYMTASGGANGSVAYVGYYTFS